MRTKIFISALIFCATVIHAQKRYERVALLNGIAHIGDGRVIEGSVIVINGEKIQSVAASKDQKLNFKAYDTVIDVSGKHVYPGIINTNNILGLHDAEAVRAANDHTEVGGINPHVRALIAYNTDNQIVPTVKTNGILYTQVCPRGGLISGSSSVMKLEGWNWEDAVIKADDGIHVNFPRITLRKWSSEDDAVMKSQNKKYNEEVNFLEKFFSDAAAYCREAAPAEKNIRFEAMRTVMNGSANLYLHAEKAKDILGAVAFAARHSVKRPVIVGGKESYMVTRELRKSKVPVMLGRVNDLPDNPDDDVDIIYRTPALLRKDSILFCLQLEGDMEAMHSRNLPFNAGVAAGNGLDKEYALSCITLNAAKILGLDRDLGTLEEGKLASLVVSDGDILDIRSNNIILAYIAGKPVNLRNRQNELYDRYRTKYGLK